MSLDTGATNDCKKDGYPMIFDRREDRSGHWGRTIPRVHKFGEKVDV
jgi:hypothetical protein